MIPERGFEHPLPWHVQPPYTGCDGRRMQHSVWDCDGGLVCEIIGDGDGRRVAVFLVERVNRAGSRVCANCGAQATCFGSYEDELHPAYACDECCAHGCEDGHCERVTAILVEDER